MQQCLVRETRQTIAMDSGMKCFGRWKIKDRGSGGGSGGGGGALTVKDNKQIRSVSSQDSSFINPIPCRAKAWQGKEGPLATGQVARPRLRLGLPYLNKEAAAIGAQQRLCRCTSVKDGLGSLGRGLESW